MSTPNDVLICHQVESQEISTFASKKHICHGCHRAKVRARWWFLWQKLSLLTDIKLASSSLSGQNFRCPGSLSWLCETSITFRRNPKQWTSLAHPSFVWGSREAWQLNAHFFLAARGLLLASPLCHERCTSGGRSIQLLDWQLEGLKHDHEPDRFLVTTNWMALIFRPWVFLDVYECFLNNKLVETSEIQNHTQRNFALKLN